MTEYLEDVEDFDEADFDTDNDDASDLDHLPQSVNAKLPDRNHLINVVEGWKDESSHSGGSGSMSECESRTMSQTSSQTSLEQKNNLTGLFNLGEYAVDLVLDNLKLSWKKVNEISSRSSKKNKCEIDTVLLTDVIAVKIRRVKSPNTKSGRGGELGICQGMDIYTFTRKSNRLKEKMWFFQHPSTEVCNKFAQRINSFIEVLTNRPSKIKLYVHKHAGSKDAPSLYTKHVQPLLEVAGIEVDYIELTHSDSLKQDILHTELDNYDCFVAMGGDGTVNKLVNSVLSKSQSESYVDIRPDFNPVENKVPVAVIPCGTTNHIVTSIQGISDIVTATIYLVLGLTTKIDICTVYSMDKFLGWAFNSQYGFYGSVEWYRYRYSHLRGRQMELAYIKSLSKGKLRSYECDIKYLPSPNKVINWTKDEKMCHNNCITCSSANSHRDDDVHSDELIELDPLAQSGSSSIIMDLKTNENGDWKTARGNFLNVGLFTIPGRCAMAPRGMSKSTHIADGSMDLVLTRSTDRKSFIKFLKRHGNSKNQFDYPFVEVVSVKEVIFKQRKKSTWKHRDHSYNEINEEMAKVNIKKLHKSASMDVIDVVTQDDDFEGLDVDDDNKDIGSCSLSSTGQNSETASLNDDNSEADSKKRKNKFIRKLSLTSLFNGVKGRRMSMPTPPPPNLPVVPRPHNRIALMEKETLKRRLRKEKKEKKIRDKEESSARSIWCIDNEKQSESDLHFVVQSQLLRFVGQGVHDPFTPDDMVRYIFLTQVP